MIQQAEEIRALRDQKAVVVGLGESGVAAARFLAAQGLAVYATDSGSDRARLLGRAHDAGIVPGHCELGGHTEAFLSGSRLIVLSPGIPLTALPVSWARARGVPVIGEIELAGLFCDTPIIAVTGTNGKTTVMGMLRTIFQTARRPALVCGNIGNPFIGEYARFSAVEAVLLEVSSFQLSSCSRFRPHIAVLLNITEDHLDHHADMAEYIGAKMKLFENQGAGDWAVLNADDRIISSLSPVTQARTRFFSTRGRTNGAFLQEGVLYAATEGPYLPLMASGDIPLAGLHNRENAMAAALAALAFGIERSTIAAALSSFRGVSYRMERTGMVQGRNVVNDSKSTTVDSTRRALESFSRGVILIAGGKDKKLDYAALRDMLPGRVKTVIVIGEARQRIWDALAGSVRLIPADTLPEAVDAAFSLSAEGDTILLSPMCSSFDMFTSYVHRGKVFDACVDAVRQGRSATTVDSHAFASCAGH